MVRFISPAALKSMIRNRGEFAILDLREEGVFARSHLLLAVSLPLSRLELHLAALVPRCTTRIVLCDDNDGLALQGAAKFARYGYSDITILDGGVSAWRNAGFELFSGTNVPSKIFGEFVEHHYHTPSISAQDLKKKLDRAEDVIILDSRPWEEYQVQNIPGGVCVPGAELAYRARELIPSPETLVVVNCAGRTRSIMGAQTLINTGLPNRVVALRNGTMGWHLAGFDLEHGAKRRAPAVSPAGLQAAKTAAARIAARFGVREIDREILQLWQAESEQRSLYLLDVRSPEEFTSGHLAGSRNAPGGQLAQATDGYVGTRNARLVLIDNDGVRATIVASWLMQMGWREAVVLRTALDAGAIETGPAIPQILGLEDFPDEEMEAEDLVAALKVNKAVVIDLALSPEYKAGHIGGAWFAVRSRLAAALARIPRAEMMVLTSPDGVLARLAAPELSCDASVKVLQGGTRSWRARGLPLTSGFEHMADEPEDVYLRPYHLGENQQEEKMRAYLAWEFGLLAQLARDGDLRFAPP
ncbi:MAG TPA: rhodanese-like domain-containing protein [Acidiferrobacterales bacterium]|nr:rhodanese-like domain-containing protein [Acidiferrobacterales bacterium]